MYKRVFLDANVFIDVNDESRDPDKLALQVLDYLVSNDIKIFTSCDLITTIYYILSKKDKLNALNQIEQLNKFCKIIDFGNDEVLQTTNLMRENMKFKDLEDTIQYILASKEGCDLIISNDKNFVSENIELLTTYKAIKKLNLL
ncbi:MAG: PIN domain-containing protein [Campylobacterota bacterium]|nr:PIN domain-containing protein [Campylobacterota bacterium]